MKFIFADNDRTKQLARIRDKIAQCRDDGASDPAGFQMHAVYDELLAQCADHFLGPWKDCTALLGLGGYGRKEMSPYSDIDMLFLTPNDASEQVYQGIRDLLYLLWDARIELGHSVRTASECVQEAQKDLAVLTSLLDARFIWGDGEIYRQLVIHRERLLLETDPLDLYLRVEAELRRSSEKFVRTIYLLEPHIKEGPGSLRYIQLIAWLVRMIFGISDLDDLPHAGICGQKTVDEVKAGRNFLAEVRTRLHFLAGRRDDRLKFDDQPVLAQQMGFPDTQKRRGVEAFMREYYRHAAVIDFFGRRVLARTRLFLRPKSASEVKRLKLDDSFYIGAGGINHDNPEEFGKDAEEILLAFTKISQTRCELDIRLVDLILERLQPMNNDFTNGPEVNRLFLSIFKRPGSVALTLNSMLKVGFLERFIQEFARVRFLPQHDIYHQYTVDLHTIAVLEHMDSFAAETGDRDDILLRTLFSRLENPEVLYLAGLFHDIAKGAGPGHDIRGEESARPILMRLGLPPDHVDEVCFLIRNHLAMTHLAFKKDLHDEALVNRFAENVMRKRRLDLLLLLTHADLRAVGPTAFNSWRRMLLEELYYRTLDVIEGEEDTGEDLDEWVKQIKAAIRSLVPADLVGVELERYLEDADSRYFLDFLPDVIAAHFTDLYTHLRERGKTELDAGDLIADKVDRKEPGYSAITLIVKKRRGLFCRIAGALSASRINILSAWSHSIGNIVVATFHVNDIPEGVLNDPERWNRFRSEFGRVLREEVNVDVLMLARQSNRRVFGTPRIPRFPLKVEIDNAASDFATIVEVYAHDRVGLLYDITRKMNSLGMNIVLTKITTEIDQAADIFYVQDDEGHKIIDFDRLDEMKESLRAHLVTKEKEYFGDHEETVS